MHAEDFQEPKEDAIWTKHQINQETMVVQIIPKNQINTRLTPKTYLIIRS